LKETLAVPASRETGTYSKVFWSVVVIMLPVVEQLPSHQISNLACKGD